MADDPRDPFGSIIIAEPPPEEPPARPPEDREPAVVIGSSGEEGPHPVEKSGATAKRPPSKQSSPFQPDMAPGGRLPGWLKTTGAVALLLFLSYCLFGFLGLPYLIQSVLPDIMAKKLQRQITFGRVDFNPFTLVLRLENTIIGPRLDLPDDRIDPLFSAGAVEGDISAWSLLRGKLICSRLTATKLFLHIERNHEHIYNTAHLIPLQKSPAFPFYRLPFPLLIGDLSIRESRIVFSDLPAGRSHTLDDITLVLPLMPREAGQEGDFPPGRADTGTRLIAPSFSAVINGSPIAVSGESSIQDSDVVTRLSLRLNGVDVPAYLAYLPGWKPPVTTGTADIDVEAAFHLGAAGPADLAIDTRIRLADITLAGEKNQGGSLPMTSINASLFPLENRWVIHEILIKDPVVTLTRKSDGTWALPLPAPIMKTEKRGEETPFTLAVKKTAISNGTITISDERPGQPLSSTFTDVTFSLTTPEPSASVTASFSLTGATAEGSPISAQGEFDPLSRTIAGELTAASLPLAAVTPYLALGGHRLEQGTIRRLNSRFTWTDTGEQAAKMLLPEGTVIIGDATLGPPQATLFSSPALELDFSGLDVTERDIDTLHIRGEEAEISIIRAEDGRLNWSGQSADSPATAGASGSGWEVDKFSFSLAKTTITVNDASLPTPLALNIRECNLTGSALSTRPGGTTGRIALQSADFGQGTLTLEGPLTLSPFAATLRCTLDDFQLAQIPATFSDWLTLSRFTGAADADGTLQLPGFSYSGSLTIRDLTAAGAEGPPVLGWTEALVEGVTLKLAPFSLTTEKLSLIEPFLHWRIAADGAMNIASLLNRDRMKEKGFVNNGQVSLPTLAIQDGALDFQDNRVTPPYPRKLVVQATMKNLVNLPSSRLRLDLTAAMDTATAAVNGELGFFEGPLFADLRAEIDEVPITQFTPYLTNLLDAEITGGTFSLASRYRREEQAFDADTTLRVAKLRFAAPSQEHRASTLPGAVALLSDAEETITLTLPLRGEAGDSAASFPAALGRAIRAIPLKGKVSPLALLKNDFPEESGALDHLLFPPGSAALTEKQKTALTTIARILAARPLLQLTIRGFAGQDADRQALLRLKTEKNRRSREEQEASKTQRITEKYGREEIAPLQADQPPNMGTDAPNITVSTKELLNLATKRAQTVSDFLARERKIPSSRLLIADAALVAPGAPGLPASRVDLRFDAGAAANQ